MEKVLRILVIALFAVALVASTGQPARAAEEGMKGLGISGYVDAVGAFSHASNDYFGGTLAPGLYAGTASLSGVAYPAHPVNGNTLNDDNAFVFAGSELKLHFNRDFADKAFAVGSLSLQSAAAGGGASSTGQFNFDVQQAAVGLKFGDTHLLLGRFYAPIGIESVDANSRATATLGNVFAGLEPFYLTGAMLHYAPEEGVGAFFFASNNIQDGNDDANNAKALGVGLTLATGDVSATLQYNVDWTNKINPEFQDASQLIDLSILMDNDTMLGGIDAIYRRENSNLVTDSTAAPFAGNVDIFGAEALLGFKMDDLTIGGRGEWIHIIDTDGILAASVDCPTAPIIIPCVALAPGAVFLGDGDVYSATAFVTYNVVEGVFVRAEYRLDFADYDKLNVGGTIVNPDTANTQVALVQLNASFE